MTPLAWSILLLVAGLALIFLEVFIPSAGVLSILAATAVLCSVVMAYYYYGLVTGTIFLGVGVVAVPIALAAALKWYPNTSLGRRIIAQPPTPDEFMPEDEQSQRLKSLKGKLGVAKTNMLPGGMVRIDRRTYNAVSQGGAVDAGDTVVVVRVEGNHLVVRKSDRELQPHDEKHRSDGDDVLSQPIETLGIDPMDDPLA